MKKSLPLIFILINTIIFSQEKSTIQLQISYSDKN
jgi:hypothetical protein